MGLGTVTSFSFFLSHSLLPSLFLSAPRALSRRAFRSHTDTAGLIRVRLTYCLIIGPPRERVAGPIVRAAPRRAARRRLLFPPLQVDGDLRKKRARQRSETRLLINHVAETVRGVTMK